MVDRDIFFMREALKLAREAASAGEVPIGAVAVRGDAIVASGRNRVEERHSVSAHAEFEVVRELEKLGGDWRMSDYELYLSCAATTGAQKTSASAVTST